MREITDSQLRILKEEFPYISFETDSDIERYFELWKTGKQKEALDLYNTKLRRKFPDDAVRAELLRCYRSRDPKFRRLLYENICILAEKVEKRVLYVISVLTEKIDTVKLSDAYSVIRFAESLLSMISSDRLKAISFTEKYARYAAMLNFRPKEMKRTAELIRMYITDTVASVQDLKKERMGKRAPQKEKKREPAVVDFSQITFTKEDVARIVIPQNIRRVEDTVIAYCLKYWNAVFDAAFERIIVLYSKKYRTKHSEVFFAVKNGRLHGWKDEEILNAVLMAVVSGYYYSISGDLYLQRTWRYYKSAVGLSDRPAAQKPQTAQIAQPALPPGREGEGSSKTGAGAKALPAPKRAASAKSGKLAESEKKPKPSKSAEAKAADVGKSGRLSASGKSADSESPEKKASSAKSARGTQASKRPVTQAVRRGRGAQPAAKNAGKNAVLRTEKRQAKLKPPVKPSVKPAGIKTQTQKPAAPQISAPQTKVAQTKAVQTKVTQAKAAQVKAGQSAAVRRNTPVSVQKPGAPRAQTSRTQTQPQSKAQMRVRPQPPLRLPPAAFSAPRGSNPNSVADIIKRLSGETYTVYREIFFQEIRPSIREELSAFGSRKGIGFGVRHNEAEDIVYNYLMAHYDDPYQDWDTCAEKKKIEALGFRLKSLDAVIKRWVLSKRR